MSTVAMRPLLGQAKPKVRITRQASKGHRAHVAYRQPAKEWAPTRAALHGVSEAFRSIYNSTEEFTDDFFEEL